MSKARKLILALGSGAILLAIFLSINFVRQKYVAPIIMYHAVFPDAPSENRLAVSTKSFQRQMSFLKKHKYNVIPLEELVELIRVKAKIPPKTIAITFDDGYRNFYQYAFPVLKEYSLPATMFIIINEVGRPQNDRLSWNEIMAMQDSGIITFGSHTLGPGPLINIKPEQELRRQIFDSKKVLEAKLGRAVNLFSYPEGRFTCHIRQLVIDSGYKAAVATNPGLRFPDEDIFALKRLRISSTSDNLFVFWIETSGYYNFIREKRQRPR